MQTDWSKEMEVGIAVCDGEGVMISMNDMAAKIFRKSGGLDLIGQNMLDCHPENAKKKILELFEKKQSYCYTVEKNGIKSMLHQVPWFEEGKFKGFVEFIFILPEDVPKLNEVNWVKK